VIIQLGVDLLENSKKLVNVADPLSVGKMAGLFLP
jgi:hypothetical protein